MRVLLICLFVFFSQLNAFSQFAEQEESFPNAGDSAYFSSLGIAIDSCSYLPLYKEMCVWLGTRYRYAGTSTTGIDCSGLTKYFFQKLFNISLQGGSASIFTQILPVKKEDLREGDLVFFNIRKGQISHVGIYLGNNLFLHASVKLGVIVSSLDEPYYQKYFYSGGRVP